MSTIGDQSSTRFLQTPRGTPTMEQYEPLIRTFKSFRSGYISADAAQDIPEDSTPYALDMQVDSKDRPTKTPGVIQTDELDYEPVAIFTHASLDNETELVMIAPPYLGVKNNLGVDWYDLNLPSSQNWVAANHGGELVFSDGETSIWKREFGSSTIEDLGYGPATTIESFAGRLFYGNAVIGGVDNPLAIGWTGSSGLPGDPTGLGSGAELLLSDAGEGDRVVALRAMNFDLMAILMRNSVWVAQRTFVPTRPADFSPRVQGVGCAAEATATKTPVGIIFLSDAGVELFDGNTVQHISTAIDPDLLPIDYTKLHFYSASYSRIEQKYILHTPIDTWEYDIRYNRWFRRSLVAFRSATIFNPSEDDPFARSAGWDEYWSGYWGSAPGTNPGEQFIPIRDIVYLSGSLLGYDHNEAMSYFGKPFSPTWTLPRLDAGHPDRLVEIQEFTFEYFCHGECVIEYYSPDSKGEMVKRTEFKPDNQKLVRRVRYRSTGRGLQVQLRMRDYSPHFVSFTIIGRVRGRLL